MFDKSKLLASLYDELGKAATSEDHEAANMFTKETSISFRGIELVVLGMALVEFEGRKGGVWKKLIKGNDGHQLLMRELIPLALQDKVHDALKEIEKE